MPAASVGHAKCGEPAKINLFSPVPDLFSSHPKGVRGIKKYGMQHKGDAVSVLKIGP
ncbi:hypothetical protein [Chryseobacterium taklimakanense]|uniref:hypothetical protein n=1 Tax=Chryseobacterium taklimakanense TaxID=536441 RepID=UPI0023F6B12E|nr:hypothetical protein [Chryseobacterium taklimakanense]